MLWAKTTLAVRQRAALQMVAVVALCWASAAAAQTTGPAGTWEGTVTLTGTEQAGARGRSGKLLPIRLQLHETGRVEASVDGACQGHGRAQPVSGHVWSIEIALQDCGPELSRTFRGAAQAAAGTLSLGLSHPVVIAGQLAGRYTMAGTLIRR
jgi:hypothetical protein